MEQRELEDGLEREIKDGVEREIKDGVEREIEDGLEQEIEDGLDREIEAVKSCPQSVAGFLGQLLAHGVLPRGGNGCLMGSTERAGAQHIVNVRSKTMSPSHARSEVDKRSSTGERSPFLKKMMFRGERARMPSPKTPLVLFVMSLKSW